MRRLLPDWLYEALGPLLVALALTGAVAAVTAQPAPSPREQPVSVLLDAATREAVVDAFAEDLVRDYAHADIGAKMAKATQDKLAAGGYDGIDSPVTFAGALTADAHAVASDKHLRVWFDDRSDPGMPSSTSLARAMLSRMIKMNGAIPHVEILEGNIGYLEVDGMPPPQLAKPVMTAAFAFLQGTDALIIDLRGNGGGDPQTDALYMSFLSTGAPYVLNRFHWRSPEHVTETDTTALGSLSYGSDKPVYCLTSRRTFSGGEELAYDLQAFKRGIIVGERTAGGANPSNMERLGHGFWALVPDGYVINPMTRGNWEGGGVVPNVQVPADAALVTAEQLAIARLAARSTEPPERAALEAVGHELVMREAAIRGHTIPKLRGAQLVGAYRSSGRVGVAPGGGGLAYVTRQDGALFLSANVPNMPPARLVAMAGNLYHLDGYPSDFTAVFGRSRTGGVRLVLNLSSAWPAAILQRVSAP